MFFQKNIIHRDIKPENILLDENLNVQLTDFGLAKEMTKKQRLFDCVGTPGYLAPEVLEAGMCADNSCLGYSFEVDAWACGVVMYTLLVGMMVWPGVEQIIIKAVFFHQVLHPFGIETS